MSARLIASVACLSPSAVATGLALLSALAPSTPAADRLAQFERAEKAALDRLSVHASDGRVELIEGVLDLAQVLDGDGLRERLFAAVAVGVFVRTRASGLGSGRASGACPVGEA